MLNISEAKAQHQRIGLFKNKIEIAPDFDKWPDDVARSLG
jgi:hypothetical protein